RKIEQLWSGREKGDSPEDRPDPRVEPHVLRFEVTAETYATWRDAVALLRQESGGQLKEDEAFLMMARQVLGGRKDPGCDKYQVGMTVCSACGQGYQQGRGESIAISNDVLEMALCDAQHIVWCLSDTTQIKHRVWQSQ